MALRNIVTTEIMPIEDAIGLASDEKPVGATFYVATNEHRHYGATAVLLQPEVLDEQERKLGNFHIIRIHRLDVIHTARKNILVVDGIYDCVFVQLVAKGLSSSEQH